MKVISVNIFPQYGSTGKLVWEIHKSLLKNGDSSLICYGRGEKIDDSRLIKISKNIISKAYALLTRFYGQPYNCSFFETAFLIKLIKRESPDIVHLHCLNCFYVNMYQLMSFLKQEKIKTVLTLHAEIMYTGGCAHSYDCEKWKFGCDKCPNLWEATHSYFFDRTKCNWNKLNDVYRDFNNLTLVAVSSWISKRAMLSPMFSNKKILTINNGINTSVFRFLSVYKSEEVSKILYKNSETKIVLHVNPTFSDPLKGGEHVIDFAKKVLDENVVIVIVGYRGAKEKLPANVISFDLIKSSEILAELYSIAHITLLTSKRETFSLVCAESLCCGTPIIGFKAGAPEEISLSEYSEFVDYANLNDLYVVYKKWINFKTIENAKEISHAAITEYSSRIMCEKYLNLYKLLAK